VKFLGCFGVVLGREWNLGEVFVCFCVFFWIVFEKKKIWNEAKNESLKYHRNEGGN